MAQRSWDVYIDGECRKTIKASCVRAAEAQVGVAFPGAVFRLQQVATDMKPTGYNGRKFTFEAFGGGTGEFI